MIHNQLNEYDYLIDLFSGAGGFTKGLIDAGIKFKQIFYSDINKYANAVYKYNYPEHKELGDVKNIVIRSTKPEIPNRPDKFDNTKNELEQWECVDNNGSRNGNYEIRTPNGTFQLPRGRGIITFGFPCQDLSIAGKRKGLDGHRSGLFYEATRIIRDLKPDIFIFENVKGLFSANKGQAFVSVLREIADIRFYDCEWQLVNSKWFLPQNRERIYFVGNSRKRSSPKVFPIKSSNENAYGKHKIVNCIDANYGRGDNRPDNKSGRTLIEVAGTNKNSQGQRIYDPKGISCQLTAQGGGQGAKTGLYAIDLKTAHGISKTRMGGIKKEETPILDHNCGVGIANAVTPDAYLTSGKRKRVNGKAVLTSMHERRIRRLTPRECEKLQGFPIDWTAKGNFDGEIKEISDTQRYKLMGNAITTKIVEMIGKKLI